MVKVVYGKVFVALMNQPASGKNNKYKNDITMPSLTISSQKLFQFYFINME